MHNAPDIDAQHPLPVLDRVLPDQAAGAHTGVVEHEVRRAETRGHGIGKALHLGFVGNIDLARQHGGTCGLQLSLRLVQGVLLNVHQHQVHAQAGTDARALEAKA